MAWIRATAQGTRAGANRSWVARFCNVAAVRFVLLGLALFALHRTFISQPRVPTTATVVLSAVDAAQLRNDWRSRSAQWPTTEQEEALVQDWFGNEVLYREALARKLDQSDLVVWRRLMEKMRLLAEDGEADEAALHRQAVELDLGRNDPIVRRRLIHKMQLAIEAEGGPIRVSESQLRRFFTAHRGLYQEPERYRFSQIFLSADRRAETLHDDASNLLSALADQVVGSEEATTLGDLFLLEPPRLGSPQQLERMFGEQFVAHLSTCQMEVWCGPVPSAYGLHLIRIEEHQPAHRADFERVRHQVRTALLEKLRQERSQRAQEELQRRYRLQVEASVRAERFPLQEVDS